MHSKHFACCGAIEEDVETDRRIYKKAREKEERQRNEKKRSTAIDRQTDRYNRYI